MEGVAKKAAGLSKAQRHWLPWFTPEPFAGRPCGMSKGTLARLITAGLVVEDRPQHFGMVKWSLSPLGLAVRDYLERNPQP